MSCQIIYLSKHSLCERCWMRPGKYSYCDETGKRYYYNLCDECLREVYNVIGEGFMLINKDDVEE